MPLQNPAISDELLVNTSTSRQQTYKVTKDGDITMPTLGKIHVEGMTTNELSEYLTRRIAQDVEGPFVRVELVNFKINVIGEVNSPGAYTFSNERVSVLDALAQAGDMTIFGRRENVTIVREENGKVAYHKLDLTDSKVVNSPYYYLKQNDVVYVEPTEVKKGQSEYNQNNSYKVSVVSAIVSGCSVVVSLLIALLVK
jgi:polysaccharide export outer membrane protein